MPSYNDFLPYEQDLIRIRRHIHAHPECGFGVRATHDFVAAELRAAGIAVAPHVGKNSLLGILENGSGPVVGLRADMDALPMLEENAGLEYRSTVDGRMHACGHDAHTAMLLTAAKFLNDHRGLWKGTVRLIFQEAEEGPSPGGADGIVASGLLDDVECFYALHVSPAYPSGTIAIKTGEAMAAADTIRITLHGRGAHAAYPHLSVDPILMQAEVVTALQALVSRTLDPTESAVVTIAQVHAGTTHNIIPASAFLEGTVRTFNETVRERMKQGIEDVLRGVTAMRGGSYDYHYEYGYDPTVNAAEPAARMRAVTGCLLGEDRFVDIPKASMGAEDFSKYIAHRTGCIAWLGTRAGEDTGYGLHHPRFNVDEGALLSGAAVLAGVVIHGSHHPKEEE
ncbi:MAG: amidohydrolase [Candidatus Izemoplasmatales bacterium]